MTLKTFGARMAALALGATIAIAPLSACSNNAGSTADKAKQEAAGEAQTQGAWILTKETYHTEDADHSVYESVYTYTIDERGNQTGVTVTTVGDDYEQSYMVNYELDDQGSCVAMTANYGEGDEEPVSFTYEYDDQGRVIKRSASNDQIETYVYDEQGNIIEQDLEFTIVDKDGTTTNKSMTTYDANGFCTKRSYESAGETWNYLYTYELGENGLPATGTGTDETTGATTQYSFEYDKDGNLNKVTSNTDGAIETTTLEWTMVADASPDAAAQNRLKMFV